MLGRGSARVGYVHTYLLSAMGQRRVSLLNLSTPGFGFSFGVFQDYYTSHLPFKGEGNIAVVGTTTLVSFLP